jgi:DNA-binding beta-propeller fold protein YncE
MSPDGTRVFVTGLAGAEFNHNDGDTVTIAYDASSGEQLWTRSVDEDGGLDLVRAATVSPDSETVYITGSARSNDQGAHTDAVTYAFDAATGQPVWSARYDGPIGDDDTGMDLLATSETLFVAVTSAGMGDPGDYDTDIVVVAYDSADPEHLGEQLWVSRHDGGIRAGDGAVAISQSPGGSRLYVTGSMQETGSSASGYNIYNYATIALDPATGSRLWKKLFQGPSRAISLPTSLAVTPSDMVVVTGSISGQLQDTDWDYGTVAYRGATGEQLWAKSYGFPRAEFESAEGIALSPDGSRVYVTGFSRVDQWQDVATVAYDAESGTELWVARYNHATTATNFDHGDGVATTAGGNVLVAASLTDNLGFYTHPGSTNFNYGDFGLLSYEA